MTCVRAGSGVDGELPFAHPAAKVTTAAMAIIAILVSIVKVISEAKFKHSGKILEIIVKKCKKFEKSILPLHTHITQFI